MESLWLLVPLSAGLVLVILAVFGWAVQGGQFDDLEHEGRRVLEIEAASVTARDERGGQDERPIG